MEFLYAWLGFIVSTVVVIWAGDKLVEVGEKFVKVTGLSGGFVAFVFLASATSLPELAAAVGAVTVVKQPDIAISDVLGSNVFNIVAIAIADLFSSKPLFHYLTNKTKISGIKMVTIPSIATIFVLAALIIAHVGGKPIVLFSRLDLISLVLFILWIISLILNYEKHEEEGEEIEDEDEDLTFWGVLFEFLIWVSLIVVSGIGLSKFGDRLAQLYHLTRTFIGGFLIAISTSLPELVVAISAAKRNKPDMVIGNMLGSNIFNLSIIFVSDLLWPKSIFSHLSLNSEIVLCLVALLLGFLLIAQLTVDKKSATLFGKFEIITPIMLLVYLFSSYLTYVL